MDSAPLGCGYVKLFADMHGIRHPGKQVSVINKGIGGDNVVGLRNRWNDDVVRNRPDWLSIKIGINDLHGFLREDPDPIPPARYREAYTEILERTRKELPRCKLLLIDPFYISTDRSPNSFRSVVLSRLPEYCRVVDDLSRSFGTLHIKTHALFQRLLKTHEPDTFCPEPVHPNLTGHLAIADAVYAALTGR
jgi:lysophospholipase L1-like esterase